MSSLQFPPRWSQWPHEARARYVWYNRNRRELYRELADLADYEPRDDAGDAPRLRKEELCAIYVALREEAHDV